MISGVQSLSHQRKKKEMKLKTMLIASALSLATLAPVATVVSSTPAYAYSGQHCIDPFGPADAGHHVCATVYGTGLDVTQVGYKVNALLSTPWCGTVLVVLAWPGNTRDYYSPHGCSGTASTGYFNGALNVNVNTYPYNATVKVYARSDVGRPPYAGYVGFNTSP
jgi:hypothetical protein